MKYWFIFLVSFTFGLSPLLCQCNQIENDTGPCNLWGDWHKYNGYIDVNGVEQRLDSFEIVNQVHIDAATELFPNQCDRLLIDADVFYRIHDNNLLLVNPSEISSPIKFDNSIGCDILTEVVTGNIILTTRIVNDRMRIIDGDLYLNIGHSKTVDYSCSILGDWYPYLGYVDSNGDIVRYSGESHELNEEKMHVDTLINRLDNQLSGISSITAWEYRFDENCFYRGGSFLSNYYRFQSCSSLSTFLLSSGCNINIDTIADSSMLPHLEAKIFHPNIRKIGKRICIRFHSDAVDVDNDGFPSDIDCDDNDPNINLDATEIPGNGIDEDCDGVDGTVGTYELADANISIFPNPTSSIINAEVDGNLQYSATLWGMDGKQLATTNNTLDVSAFPNGVYLLVVTDVDSGHRIVKRIIKSN